jgi:hypothetical protein
MLGGGEGSEACGGRQGRKNEARSEIFVSASDGVRDNETNKVGKVHALKSDEHATTGGGTLKRQRDRAKDRAKEEAGPEENDRRRGMTISPAAAASGAEEAVERGGGERTLCSSCW